MKPDLQNIDEVVKHYWPPNSIEEMQTDIERVRRRLESGTAPSINPSRAQRFRWYMATAAASILLLAGAGVLAWRHSVPFALAESEEGSLFRVADGMTTPIRARERLQSGETVRTGQRTSAQFLLADGSRVEMRAASELLLEHADDGARIRLNTGSVIVNAAKQNGGHLYVQTKNEEAEGSRIGVIEGEVQVQRSTGNARLLPGEHLETNPLMNPISLEQAVSWSRHAESHVALLEQTVVAPNQAPLRFESEQTSSATPSATSLEFAAASIRPDTLPPVFTPLGAVTGQVLCRGIDGLVGRQVEGAEGNGYPTVAPLGRCIGRSVSLGSLVAAAYGARSV